MVRRSGSSVPFPAVFFLAAALFASSEASSVGAGVSPGRTPLRAGPDAGRAPAGVVGAAGRGLGGAYPPGGIGGVSITLRREGAERFRPDEGTTNAAVDRCVRTGAGTASVI